MKMKKLLYIFIVFSLGLVSCTERLDIPNSVPADCIMLNVFNSPMTKAQNWAGLDYERQLLRLDCFFYPKGQTDAPCVYYQKVDVNEIGSAEIPFYVDESVINTIFPSSDECDVFVIANLTSGTFAKGQTGTDVPTLSKTVLTLDGNRDAIDKPFIMQGLHIATKGDNNNASGTIPLHRAAAKVTITVNIPEKIEIEYENADKVTMTPVLSEDTGAIPFKTAFHNGVKKTYLRDDYSSQLVAEDAHHVGKQNYVAAGEVPAVGDIPKKYTFTCEIPFYTYARAWEKGAEDAAYLTFEMPWTNVSDPENPITQTYYYQILVNSGGRCFGPNNWYDLTVNVGVIGSTVESEPVTIQDLTYYVLDWTTEPDPEHEAGGDRYEDVNITDYTYLIVPEPKLVINNASTGVIHFEASHNVGIKMNTETKKEVFFNTDVTLSSYYINCGVGKTERPKVQSMGVDENDFTVDNNKNTLTYNFDIPSSVYSPIYVYATIWLELDGKEGMSAAEEEFSEDIVIVQYPPMYIIPDESNVYSVYVNRQQTNSSTDYKIGNHNLGRNPGHSNTNWDNNPSFMLSITVSSFTASNTFKAHDGNYYPYIIGDPRSRISDIELDDDNNATNISSNWVSADAVKYDANGNIVRDANGAVQYETRSLQYYYPTETEGNAFQIVSPKFRMVSFFSSGWGNITSKGAEMRCATYQEDGYPAGRWRLPTEAEIMFVVDLQKAGVITDVFYGSSQYFSSTDVDATHKYKISYPTNGTPTWSSATTGSVRCVYDEWYWGDEREAKINPDWKGSHTTKGDNEYLFTWGDKKIW